MPFLTSTDERWLRSLVHGRLAQAACGHASILDLDSIDTAHEASRADIVIERGEGHAVPPGRWASRCIQGLLP